MILIDANLLLYAYDGSSQHHDAARVWLEGVLVESRTRWHGLGYILAFLRITTHPRAFEHPLSTGKRAKSSRKLRPMVRIMLPTERQSEILRKTLGGAQARVRWSWTLRWRRWRSNTA